MRSFVVETYVPGDAQARFPAEVDGIRTAALAAIAGGPVRLVRSYLVPGDEMGFHVVEADSTEAVALVAVAAGIEVERIVEAIGVAPGRSPGDDGPPGDRRIEP